MKLLLAAFLAIALASVQGNTENSDKVKHYSEGCFEETGADHVTVENARKGEFVEDEKLLKYCMCMYNKMHLMNGEGHILEENMLKYVPENIEKEEASKVIKKCIVEVHDETSHEKKAFNFYKCFVHSVGKPVHVFKNLYISDKIYIKCIYYTQPVPRIKMKTCTIILLIVAIAFAEKVKYTEEQKAKLAELKKVCVESSGVALDEVEKAKKGVFGDDEKLKEFLFCVAQKIDFMNKDGHFKADVITAKITAIHGEQIAKDVVGVCTAKTEANGPATSLALAKCLSEQSKQHVSLA
ncbi:PREDICTED: uncharacterized protein LOC108567193 [Nicrophorus vespilloides]|uniref:Uncharacterized protein LOC108567193 n=1 Tax=Nicrophorus vespilloides TaxID=110193 RepID=A0ABM1N862_NICVS|nr:PREDICTED: uncharacterized protein LOC108567193 [Nicrophorus vespilloides]